MDPSLKRYFEIVDFKHLQGKKDTKVVASYVFAFKRKRIKMKDKRLTRISRTESHYIILVAVFFILFSVVFLPINNIRGQESYPVVIGESVNEIINFMNNPNLTASDNLRSQIQEVEDIITNPGLSPYQSWSLRYVKGYLYYCLGIALGQSTDAANAFSGAEQAFGTVVQNYQSNFQQQAKMNFANYMRAWCYLRSYLIAGSATGLDNATRTLEEIMDSEHSSDVHFLNGFCYLLKALGYYEQLAVTNEAMDACSLAIQAFDQISDNNRLRPSADFFLSISKYLQVRFHRLLALRSRPDGLELQVATSLDPIGDENLTNLLSDAVTHASQASNSFQNNTNGDLGSAFVSDLSKLQLASQRVQEWITSNRMQYNSLDQTGLTNEQLSNLTTPNTSILGPLIQASAAFVGNNRNLIHPGFTGEAKFWADLTKLLSYMRQGPSPFFAGTHLESLPGNLFHVNFTTMNSRTQNLDNESRFLSGLTRVLAQQTFVGTDNVPLNNSQDLIRQIELISSFLAPAHIATNDGTSVPGDVGFSALMPAIPATPDELIAAGRLAITLAGSRMQTSNSRVLYAAAYMLFLRASGSITDIATQAEVSLYRALSLFLAAPLALHTNALNRVWNTILAPDVISGWPNDLRTEAQFYRARIRREVNFDALALNEYNIIDDTDPRAAFALGHERDPGHPDFPRLEIAACLANQVDWRCLQWMRRFYEELNYRIPSDAECSGLHLNIHNFPEQVRYFNIRPETSECNIVRQFVLDQLDLMLNLWQALSTPTYKAYPWTVQTARNNAIPGPREFDFLQETIDVPITITPAGVQSEVVVLADPQTILPQGGANIDTLHLTTGKRYMILVSASGFWPVMLDTLFTSPGASIQVALKPAHTNFLDRLKTEVTEGNLLWNVIGRKKDASLVMGPAGFSYKIQGKTEPILEQTNGTTWRSVSKVVSRGTDLDIITEESSRMIATVGRGRFVWEGALDRQEPMLYVRPTDHNTLIPACGFSQAQNDGLAFPYRLITIPGLGYFAVTDLLSRCIFLFLPNGEYVCSINVPPDVATPYHWIDIRPDETTTEVRIATSNGMERLEYGAGDDIFPFALSPGYQEVEQEVLGETGGWFSDWKFEMAP